jgi:hypothetical protein
MSNEQALRDALTELVACKDLKDRINRLLDMSYPWPSEYFELPALRVEYKRRQPLAWVAARAAISPAAAVHPNDFFLGPEPPAADAVEARRQYSMSEWDQAVRTIYLMARTSQATQGISSEMLEEMRDKLLAASPAAPSQAIPEQPESDSVYLTSAVPSEASKTALTVQPTRERLASWLEAMQRAYDECKYSDWTIGNPEQLSLAIAEIRAALGEEEGS